MKRTPIPQAEVRVAVNPDPRAANLATANSAVRIAQEIRGILAHQVSGGAWALVSGPAGIEKMMDKAQERHSPAISRKVSINL